MASKFNASMFERIKDSLNKSDSGNGGQFANIMKFPAGHTYTLRILPTLEEGKDPLFHHWVNSWKSKATGGFTSALSLRTFNEKDPISNLRWKLWKEWKDANPKAENKDYTAEITEKEQWLVNVYVIEDPSNPENNGTVKIYRFGPQIKKIIDAATEGARADELGWEIFNPTAGHDLKVVATKQGDFTTFAESFFTTKSKTKLTDEDLVGIYEQTHDLEQVYSVKTFDELQTLLDEHFFCEQKNTNTEKAERKQLPKREEKPVVDDDPDDDIPMFHDSDKPATNEQEVQNNVDDLLDGLDLD